MEGVFSVLLTMVSAIFTHLCVFQRRGCWRGFFGLSALILLLLGFSLGVALGGFWPGFYTLLCIYFLTCTLSPWVQFLGRRKRDR